MHVLELMAAVQKAIKYTQIESKLSWAALDG